MVENGDSPEEKAEIDAHIARLLKQRTGVDHLGAAIADRLLAVKRWTDMSSEERRICMESLVRDSGTEEELKTRFQAELGVEHVVIIWKAPTSKAEEEIHSLARLEGQLVSKSGALVEITL